MLGSGAECRRPRGDWSTCPKRLSSGCISVLSLEWGDVEAVEESGGVSSVTEAAFEAHIAGWLVEYGGYRRAKIGNVGDGPRDFDAEAGVDTADLFEFIGATQGERVGAPRGHGLRRRCGPGAVRVRAAAGCGTGQAGHRGCAAPRGGRPQHHHPAGVLPASAWADTGAGDPLRGQRAFGDQAAAVRSVQRPHCRPGPVRQRRAGGHRRAEEPADGPERRERRRPVPQRPSAQQPDPCRVARCTSRSIRPR